MMIVLRLLPRIGKFHISAAGLRNARKFLFSQQLICYCKPFRLKCFHRPLICSVSYALTGGFLTKLCKTAACKQGRRKSFDLPEQRELSSASLTFWELWLLISPYFLWFIGAVLSAAAVAVFSIRLPLVLGELVNGIAGLKTSHDLRILTPVALKLITVYGAQAVLTFNYISLLSFLGERVARDLRCKLFSSLIRQDIAFFDTHRTGELMSRLAGDVQEFKSAFKLCISLGLRSIMQTGGCIVSLYLISPKMTTYTVCILPLIVGVGSLLGSALRALSRRAQEQAAVALSLADEALGNIRTVRSFAMEETEEKSFQVEVNKARKLAEYLGIGVGIFQGGSNYALNAIVLAVLYGGSKLIASNDLTPGDLMSFMVTAQTIQSSMGHFSILFGQAVRGWTAGGRVFEYIRNEAKIPTEGGKRISFHSMMGEVKYRDVNFAYPSRPDHAVLNCLNLELKPGLITALCGPSGEGKSTMAALLERFYDVQDGSITIDGIDVRDLDPKWLRGKAIGFISQEPVLFSGSILENIRYGKPDATDEEVYEAARVAKADNFVRMFPNGYNTVAGERGVQLSGGQKQRVAIARALLKNPSIIILDEATSALDAESEKCIKEALDRAFKGRTVLIIAHRLSTIQNADQIAVVKRGRIEELGTHEELMKKRGMYWEMIKYQQEASPY